MEDRKYHIKNNCLSSNLLNFSGLESIRDERENELKIKTESNFDIFK